MNTNFHDKEMLTDVLASQKSITGGYNTVVNECACSRLKSDMLNILNDEHKIQHDVFLEMQKRGWYPTEAADQNKINQVKQQYSGITL
jgi:spore coat protein CotF